MIVPDEPPRAKSVSFDGVHFGMVPLSMVRDVRRIQPIDIRLWCLLIHDGRHRGHCEFTDAELGRMLGVSRQGVQRSLERLERASYIDRVGQRPRRIVLNAQGEEAFAPTLRIKSRN